MNPVTVIKHFYPEDSRLFHTLVSHSREVARKSLEIAENLSGLNPDLDFIRDAAMLHDIGIFLTRARSIGCTGDKPYICHGYLGRQILDSIGLDKTYGLVCERHTGAGITKETILSENLPLPPRDMVPVSLEEKIICVADKFYSKSPEQNKAPRTTADIIDHLGTIDPEHARRFSTWIKEFRLI